MIAGPAGGTTPEFIADPGLAADAYAFAARAHEGQERKGGGTPYISHPTAVARLLHKAGAADDELLAATFLHDVVEDTGHTAREIRERFGPEVARLVDALTEDKAIEPYDARKDHHRSQVEAAGPRAAMIYAADKLANLRDMRVIYRAEGEAAARRFNAPIDVRMRLWRADLEMVERLVPGLPIAATFREELDAFDEERGSG